MSTFEAFKLSKSILKNLEKAGLKEPTEIQARTIPPIITGRDVMGIAQTGTGKTAAFTLPMVDRCLREPRNLRSCEVRNLILTPTRELADQIRKAISSYVEGEELKVAAVFGGVSKSTQLESLASGVEILIATPGRLLDIMRGGLISFDNLECFVLDEADTMLDMGFSSDVNEIISKLPKNKQSLFFTATMSKTIKKLSELLLKEPILIEVSKESSVIDLIEQKVYVLEKSDKPYALQSLLENAKYEKVLLFCKTKFGADRIVEGLEKTDVLANAIHSNKSQSMREGALQDFKDKKIRVLVATDIAARGIHIEDVDLVVNYNLPEDPRNYVHRIGRTGRAGKKGLAVSFCVENDVTLLKSIGKIIHQKIPIDEGQPFHKNISLSFKKNTSKKKRKRLKG